MISKELTNLRDSIASSMEEAAKSAGVELLPRDIAHSVRGDIAISTALVAPEAGIPIEHSDKIFFLYLSFPQSYEIAKKIPSGYYIAERIAGAKDPRARLVDMTGKTVLELPLHIIRTEIPPERYTPPSGTYESTSAEEPVILESQALIEQSRETLYSITIATAHGIICYPGVWYWTWVVIIVL